MKKTYLYALKILWCICFSIVFIPARAQDGDTTSINRSRMKVIVASGTTLYAGSLVSLSMAWYSNQSTSTFHFFNDNSEWNQTDKFGHTYTAYQISKMGTTALQWANVSDKKSHIYGSLIGIIYQTPIEILDGFSDAYGASWGDMLANITGSGLWLGQYLLWKEERIHLKYSFHSTSYASINPNLLGEDWTQEWLKDYNGQTYWLSFDMYSLLGKKDFVPRWLNFCVGYGAEEMIRAQELSNNQLGYTSYRQYYLGLDLDLSHIKTKNKLLKTLIYFVDMIKIPGPTIEYNNREGWKFHTLYF